MSVPILSDTLVLTLNGYRRIENINKGEPVWFFNGKDFELCPISFRKSHIKDDRWFRFQTSHNTTSLFNGKPTVVGISRCWVNLHKYVKVWTGKSNIRANSLIKGQNVLHAPYFKLISGVTSNVEVLKENYSNTFNKDTLSNRLTFINRRKYSSVNELDTWLIFNPIIVNGICLEI